MAMVWLAPSVMLSMLLHAVSSAWLRLSCGTGVPRRTLTVALSPWLSVAVPVAAYEAGALGVGVLLLPGLAVVPLATGVVVAAGTSADVDDELQAVSRPRATNMPSMSWRMLQHSPVGAPATMTSAYARYVWSAYAIGRTCPAA
jgi:hypothetical protein